MWYLYTITNRVNGKQYIGITVNVGRRWIEHKSGHGSLIVYQALKKYEKENLAFDVYCEGCEEDIKQLEIILIAQLNTKAPNGYNLTDGGEGSTGWIAPEETREKMSKAHAGEKNSMFGKTHSKETRAKIAATKKGVKNPLRAELNKAYAGANNPRARKVKVNGVQYPCIKDAAQALGMKAGTLRTYFSRYKKTGHWPNGWGYVTPETT